VLQAVERGGLELAEGLQRDLAAPVAVEGQVDDTHSSRAEMPQDLEPLAADALARIETRCRVIHVRPRRWMLLRTLADAPGQVKSGASGHGFGGVHVPTVF
jgi:hypothetical protein